MYKKIKCPSCGTVQTKKFFILENADDKISCRICGFTYYIKYNTLK